MTSNRILVLSRNTLLVKEVQAAVPDCSILHHSRVEDLHVVLQADGLIDVLVAGPIADSPGAMATLERLHQEHPRLSLVLAFPLPAQTPLPEIVRSGAVDLVELPATGPSLRSAIDRALAMSSKATSAPTPATDDEKLSEVLTIASPSGGCGKTFYATNLAFYLQKRTGRRVCLVDLDLQFGEVSTALQLRPRFTMADAIGRAVEGADLDEDIEGCLLEHPAGFWVLPAPGDPSEADQIDPADVVQVIAALRKRFDYVILDTSAQLSELVLAAMDQSTRLLCMATLDLPSIRNMRLFINTLEKLSVSSDAISVVLNKVDDDLGIKLEEVNEALYGKVTSILPYAREVPRSINQGEPVLRSSPNAPVSAQLTAGMWPLVEAPGSHMAGATSAGDLGAGSGSARQRRSTERRHGRGWFRRVELRRSGV